MEPRDYEALAAAILNAKRSSLAAVPADWPGPVRRAGRVCTECHGRGEVEGNDGNGGSTGMWGCSGCSRERESGSGEWAVDTVSALAADPDGVLAIEALMREAVTRLAFIPELVAGMCHWSVYRPGEYYWHLFGTGRDMWLDAPVEMWPLARIARKPADAIGAAIETLEHACAKHPRAKRHVYSLSQDVVRELGWNALAASGESFYASRPNPFTPLVDIWARGYIPCGWERNGPMYLAAPPVGEGELRQTASL